MFVAAHQVNDDWGPYMPGYRGLGLIDCPPPTLAPVPYPTGDVSSEITQAYSYAINCSGQTKQANITNQNLYEEWKLNRDNAALNGQPPPPCPAYQQPNCQAIQQSLQDSLASGQAVNPTGWVTQVQSTPVGEPAPTNAAAPVSAPSFSGRIPQPSTPSTSGGVVPAAVIVPPDRPIGSRFVGTAPPPSSTASGNVLPASSVTPPAVQPTVVPNIATSVAAPVASNTLFGLPTWAVIGIAAAGAFLFLGGRR
jgi:hypothetical protein